MLPEPGTSVGTIHYIDLYRLNSNYTTNYPYIATYKLVPKIDKKINVEYGDELWISMKDSSNFFKNQIINFIMIEYLLVIMIEIIVIPQVKMYINGHY